MNRSTVRASLWAAIALFAAIACAPPPPPGSVTVVREPPRDRVEVVAVSPGPSYVWVRGFWRWQRAEYVWVPGRWVRPERGFRRWEPGRWRHHRGGWYWVEGHWVR